MDALLFAVALEVALLQMRVHEGSMKLGLASKVLDGKGKLQYEKLLRDSKLVKGVVSQTLMEVAGTGQWSSLHEFVDMLYEYLSCAVTKRKHYEELKTSLQEHSKTLTSKQEQWAENLRGADYKIAYLRDKMKNNLLNATARLRYAESWLLARLEAQELRFQAENRRASALNTDHEHRIHEEINKALELQIQELEKNVDYWSAKYNEDVVHMNSRLVEKRQQLAVAAAKHEELQKLYDLHEGEMRSWLSFKEQRAARLAREKRVCDAATHIQSWWRGIMVRKTLGPFKYLRNLKKSPSKSKKK